jgi:hypothetical protein
MYNKNATKATNWQSVKANFLKNQIYRDKAVIGHYNDPGYLLVGNNLLANIDQEKT